MEDNVKYYTDEDIKVEYQHHIIMIVCPKCKEILALGDDAESECDCGMVFEVVSYVVIKSQGEK